MAWEKKGDLYLKDGCYLEPLHSQKIEVDGYRLAKRIIEGNVDYYREHPPLLVPLMRGGSRPFLNMSGSFRSVMQGLEREIKYVSVDVGRYGHSKINVEGTAKADANDIYKASVTLENSNSAIIIDDVFDRGITIDVVRRFLQKVGKPIKVATLYSKPEHKKVDFEPDFSLEPYFSKEIDGVRYPCWIVFPWEVDDHEKDLWEVLYPEFAGLHPANYS